MEGSSVEKVGRFYGPPRILLTSIILKGRRVLFSTYAGQI